MIADYYRSQI